MKIQLNNIDFSYNGTPVLEDITVSIEKGELIALVGPNGSGKSTLIKCMNGILKPQSGTVLLDNHSVHTMAAVERAKKMAYVPQSGYKIPGAKVFDVVLTGRKPFISWKPSKKDVEITARILKTLHIEHIAMRDVDKLSGGQQQIVSIARALAQEPEILLLDEPVSNLDIRHQIEVMELLHKLSEQGIIIIIAIHDINMAVRYASKYIMLKNGEIFAQGGKKIITKYNIEQLFDIKVNIIEKNGEVVIVPNGLHEEFH